jgi:alpha-maltose-1-phosphate synthase
VYVFSNWARRVNVEWGADPERIEVVYPGFPTPELPPVQDRELFTFLFIGTDFERKGGFDVLEAFAAVVGDHPEARLVIVAPDPGSPNPDRAVHSWVGADRRERLLGRMRELEGRGLIARHGLLPREALAGRIYPSADAFVMPTIAEGFGFTNVEAMSFGLPVISSRAGPVEELVADRRTGLLVDAQDPEGLAAVMTSLLEDRVAARRLGADARREFLATFSLERFRSELGALYGAALNA